jgi:hypothetical protein
MANLFDFAKLQPPQQPYTLLQRLEKIEFPVHRPLSDGGYLLSDSQSLSEKIDRLSVHQRRIKIKYC